MTRLLHIVGTKLEETGTMNRDQLTELADSLAAVRAEIDAGELSASKAGRAYLEGAETALRAVVGTD